ncbi:hypothetical protein Q7M76_03040 [Candidatus Liberibacter asiaticus]|uniref:Uncharacterized protein n=2 Tax=Liberibacter asiaticus TaxID=34021 RepID=C6XFB0_LIBAP|nr:hypothetical protein [Candidatus Liberibacter asiaticus]ACT57063.1 hypothetical protein CLIBASIA_02385 [Candidatus Liberibacter asiaticus str. psy62]AGH16972.1 hypothetical protein WSI_03010 [Candidatus Liberibacter asiaticus str. gxpsy]ALK07308.1 hypothetical protein CD16_03050 [Candidatus Liberibacter asiaticus]ASK52799.1 hypothetical protein B2I23_03095 [Candidatus Liberibacter asiaticus]AWL14116.1 hypothetical protein DIC79_03120 [Candidatus Liberibacter asiaticus]
MESIRSVEKKTQEFDALLLHEKMQVAIEYQNEAWAEGMAEGIEPEIIANAAITQAIRETVRIHGEEKMESLLKSLMSRMLAGEFSPERVIQ